MEIVVAFGTDGLKRNSAQLFCEVAAFEAIDFHYLLPTPARAGWLKLKCCGTGAEGLGGVLTPTPALALIWWHGGGTSCLGGVGMKMGRGIGIK
jgi:hypothetical protein